ncbi:MAG: GbsR/MarR family transcriptional regulator [Phycisphaerales bacterium]
MARTSRNPPSRSSASRGGQISSLRRLEDRFIAAWGQMGSTWGVSRTMAEAHALLYISGEPLCTDDLMARLQVSRGNASMSLRALLDWGIIARVHKRGDRKEYFQAESDPWRVVQSVVRERMKREVHPVVAALAELRDEAANVRSTGRTPAPPGHERRLEDMVSLLRVFAALGERFVDAPPEHLRSTAITLSEVTP